MMLERTIDTTVRGVVYEAAGTVQDEWLRTGSGVEGYSGFAIGRSIFAEAVKTYAADPDGFKRLEAIVHPLVAREQAKFREQALKDGADMIVLDIPLLFETGGHARMDAVVVVSAPHHVQRERVLARPGMSADKLDQILSRQTPDAEKRAKAHFVVETDQGLDHAFAQVKAIVAALKATLKERLAKPDA